VSLDLAKWYDRLSGHEVRTASHVSNVAVLLLRRARQFTAAMGGTRRISASRPGRRRDARRGTLASAGRRGRPDLSILRAQAVEPVCEAEHGAVFGRIVVDPERAMPKACQRLANLVGQAAGLGIVGDARGDNAYPPLRRSTVGPSFMSATRASSSRTPGMRVWFRALGDAPGTTIVVSMRARDARLRSKRTAASPSPLGTEIGREEIGRGVPPVEAAASGKDPEKQTLLAAACAGRPG